MQPEEHAQQPEQTEQPDHYIDVLNCDRMRIYRFDTPRLLSYRTGYRGVREWLRDRRDRRDLPTLMEQHLADRIRGRRHIDVSVMRNRDGNQPGGLIGYYVIVSTSLNTDREERLRGLWGRINEDAIRAIEQFAFNGENAVVMDIQDSNMSLSEFLARRD